MAGSASKKKREGKKGGIQRRWLVNIVSWVVLLAVVCVVFGSIAFASYSYSNMRYGMEAKAKASADFFRNYVNLSYNDYYQSCVTFTQTFEDKNSMELQFISPDGAVVMSSYGPWSGQRPDTPDIDEAVTSSQMSVFTGRNPQTGERIMAVSTPVIYTNGEVIGVLRYVTSLRYVDQQILMAVGLAVLLGAIIITLVILSNRFFIRTILDPVLDITATAKRIAAGSYGIQIQKKYDDEIGELAETINDMSNKISQNGQMQSEFVSSVSHELRTPLTAIAGWGETLLSAEDPDPAETRRGMLIILRETKRLTQLVEELLEFTRIQDGRFTLNVQTCDLLAEFEDTVFMYSSQLRQEGIDLAYIDTIDEIPEIACDPQRLRQVFLNILDNAAKHGGEGKRITATMNYEHESIVVRIRDYGPGIPEDELPHVKMKFYKGSSKARGSGIGLAVCDEIVTMHGGTLELENADGGGTLVTISLPVGVA